MFAKHFRCFVPALALHVAGCGHAGAEPPSLPQEVPIAHIAIEKPLAGLGAAFQPKVRPAWQLIKADRNPQIAGPAFTTSASSTYPGWPTTNATDGDPATSWYSASNDSAAKGKQTFFQITFETSTLIRRVTVLGNRDPAYPKGFTILEGQLDVLDAEGRILATSAREGKGQLSDFVFELDAIEGVRAVRFTSLRDQGDQTSYGDVAIAEMRVE